MGPGLRRGLPAGLLWPLPGWVSAGAVGAGAPNTAVGEARGSTPDVHGYIGVCLCAYMCRNTAGTWCRSVLAGQCCASEQKVTGSHLNAL